MASDAVLKFFNGLVGGGEQAPPMEKPEDKPWEDESLAPPSMLDAGQPNAQPAPDAPASDVDSIIEALMRRNQEMAPYRNTGIGVE